MFYLKYYEYIETSWAVRAYGIYALVGCFGERVRFLIQTNECVNAVQSTAQAVICLFYTY